MQAAISTAAALAAAGAVPGPPQQQHSQQQQPQHQQHHHVRVAPIPSSTTSASHQQITLAPATLPTGAPSHVTAAAPGVTPIQPALPANASNSQKSLYAAYALSQQHSQPQAMAPLMFPSNAHVIPHHQQQQQGNKATSKGTQPPSIFDQMKLRRGKWTAEEESYAELLIKEFEKGTVEGCENGCTLRSFLSKKLHCAPMRISKKYAGKSIGKHVFLSRSTVNGIGKPDSGGMSNKAKLHELEMKFYKSLFRETEANMMVPPFVHYNPVMHVGHQMMGPSVNPYAPAPSFMPYSTQGQTPQAPMSWPTMPVPAKEQQQRNQLHQTFLNALNQTTLAPAPHTAAMQTVPRQIQPAAPAPIAPAPRVVPLLPASKSVSPNPMGVPLVPRAPALPPPHSQAVPSAMHMAQPQQQPVPPQQSSAPMRIQTAPHPGYEEISAGTMDIPDFLSGFDKVAARSGEPNKGVPQPSLQSAHGGNGRPSSQYSPPFTSRSFDDFHQLLGKGLSPKPLDLNNACKGFTQPPFDLYSQPNPTHAADPAPGQPPVTADSYALFAQQSALAVSQHSAYCGKDSVSIISLPNLNATSNTRQGLPAAMMTTSVVNAANLRAHSEASATKNVVSGSEKSDWGTSTEESESTGVLSRASGSESNTSSDNASYGTSNDNDSDSLSLEGPHKKKIKIGHRGQQEEHTQAQMFRPKLGQ